MWHTDPLERLHSGPDPSPSGLRNIDLAPDGAIAWVDRVGLYLWTPDGAKFVVSNFGSAYKTPTAVAFSPDGAHLAIGTSKGTVLWRERRFLQNRFSDWR